MKKLVLTWAGLILLAFALWTSGCKRDSGADTELLPAEYESKFISYGNDPIEGQYIVVLEESAVPARNRGEALPYEDGLKQMREIGEVVLQEQNIEVAKIERTYSQALAGFVVKNVEKDELVRLLASDKVKYVEQDHRVFLQGGPPGGGGGSCASNNNESTPCGIPVVNGGANYQGNQKAYVLDTGIDLDHGDLNVASYGFNAFTSGRDSGAPNDLNGHGSHVAGTIAAIGGNGIGVKGVAAGALVVSVKVLDRNGSGSWSGIIAGVDYVGANGSPGDVANMSLGGGASASVDQAVINASAGGIWFLVAAGNSSANANNYSPARANGTYVRTIAAMTCSGSWASYSNFGAPPIDFIAPGSSICSTYKDNGYASLSGTSMATPHAAGVYLMTNGNPQTCGSVSYGGVTYPKICI
jgi:subtilisin family serine protease